MAGKNVRKAYAGYPRWATTDALSVVAAAADAVAPGHLRRNL